MNINEISTIEKGEIKSELVQEELQNTQSDEEEDLFLKYVMEKERAEAEVNKFLTKFKIK